MWGGPCSCLMFVVVNSAFSGVEIFISLLSFCWYLPITVACFILDVFLEIIPILEPAFLALLGACLLRSSTLCKVVNTYFIAPVFKVSTLPCFLLLLSLILPVHISCSWLLSPLPLFLSFSLSSSSLHSFCSFYTKKSH